MAKYTPSVRDFYKIHRANTGNELSEIRYIGGGSFGKVYKATEDKGKTVILKSYYVKGMEKAEAAQLRLLSKNTTVNMPEVYYTHSDNENAFLCMSFIEGKNALDPSFLFKSRRQKQDFADAVIDGMLQWHNVKGEKFGYIDNPVYDSWKEFYIENKAAQDLEALEALMKEGNFPKKSYELLCRGFEVFRKIYTEPEAPVLIHADLNIMNIMADPKDMRLTGFIDPCGTMWADREYDLFQLCNMYGNAFRLYETYKEKYSVSEHCDLKIAFYGALHENSMRLKGGITVPVWEIQNNNRLKKILKSY